jgi:tetratricopeptide (TPR) repeat protein
VEYDEGHLTRAKHHFQEALPLARRYADKDLIAGCLINLAHVHAAQGNLVTALKLADEGRATLRETGAQGRIGAMNLEVADLNLLAGNLSAAQKFYGEALRIFVQAGQEFDSSFSLFGLGDILIARDVLAGARKQHEAALSLRQKGQGDVRALFDSRIRTAQLLLEEGHPSDAETSVLLALKDYTAQNEPDAQIEADTVLARALLAQNKLAAAQRAVAEDRKLVANTENRVNLLNVNILSARVETATGNPVDAARLLQASIEESRKSGFAFLEFEARLALGETETKARGLTAGRATLAALEKEAKTRGFMLIARKAAAVRKQPGPS